MSLQLVHLPDGQLSWPFGILLLPANVLTVSVQLEPKLVSPMQYGGMGWM